ncbi:MAG: hypothetical protein JW738_01380 [Actinobacteria bacterium]|nr:hypothetical protein [Actinomycetota bacterium]
MAADNIKKVRDAEDKAHQLLLEARNEAEQVIKGAREEAVLIKREASRKARDEGEEFRNKLMFEADAEVESINGIAAEDRERIREAGNAKIEEAVRSVLEAF